MSYISVEHLSFSYEQETVLEDISFTVEPGQFVILTGENGAAKSTLVKNILGLLTPRVGKPLLQRKIAMARSYRLDTLRNRFLLLM